MPADHAAVPPPEWAYRMAASYHGYDDDEPVGIHREDAVDTLARLLASVREGAIREAAVEGATAATEGRSVSIAIHDLLHTPPSGGA